MTHERRSTTRFPPLGAPSSSSTSASTSPAPSSSSSPPSSSAASSQDSMFDRLPNYQKIIMQWHSLPTSDQQKVMAFITQENEKQQQKKKKERETSLTNPHSPLKAANQTPTSKNKLETAASKRSRRLEAQWKKRKKQSMFEPIQIVSTSIPPPPRTTLSTTTATTTTTTTTTTTSPSHSQTSPSNRRPLAMSSSPSPSPSPSGRASAASSTSPSPLGASMAQRMAQRQAINEAQRQDIIRDKRELEFISSDGDETEEET